MRKENLDTWDKYAKTEMAEAKQNLTKPLDKIRRQQIVYRRVCQRIEG